MVYFGRCITKTMLKMNLKVLFLITSFLFVNICFYLYDKTLYKIDSGGSIWLITTYSSSLKVGELNDINSATKNK